MRRFILLCMLAFPVYAVDDQPPKLEAVPEQPDLPSQVKSGEPIDPEPEINIIRKGKKTIQEFRKNGVLYMVKVVPDVGPSYYFLDTNGDGVLDVRRSDQSQDNHINMWKILEW